MARRATPAPTTERPPLRIHPVTAHRWADLERLFEATGGPKHCWCMVWREPTTKGGDPTKQARKRSLRLRVDKRIPIGLLAYLPDGTPVAWCSVAPRSSLRPMGGPDDESAADERVWSIICFFVRRDLRGTGVQHELLDAAVAYAGKRGATTVEAQPVDPDSPSYHFMGFVETFRAAGFREVGRSGSRRHVMRRELGPRRPPT